MLEELESLRAELEELTGDSRAAEEALAQLESRLRHRMQQNRVSVHEVRRLRTHPKGAVSMKDALLESLDEVGMADSATLLEMARQKGAVTEAREPVANTDLALFKLQKQGAPVRKVAGVPHTWQKVS